MTDNWISVQKRLPKSMEDVLITDGKYVSIGYRFLKPKEAKWTDYLDICNIVTHWQPLLKTPTVPITNP